MRGRFANRPYAVAPSSRRLRLERLAPRSAARMRTLQRPEAGRPYSACVVSSQVLLDLAIFLAVVLFSAWGSFQQRQEEWRDERRVARPAHLCRRLELGEWRNIRVWLPFPPEPLAGKTHDTNLMSWLPTCARLQPPGASYGISTGWRCPAPPQAQEPTRHLQGAEK